jgi:hypothetical protein
MKTFGAMFGIAAWVAASAALAQTSAVGNAAGPATSSATGAVVRVVAPPATGAVVRVAPPPSTIAPPRVNVPWFPPPPRRAVGLRTRLASLFAPSFPAPPLAERFDLFASARYLVPADSAWDTATGVEARWHYWPRERWGCGLAVGMDRWSLQDAPLTREYIVQTPMHVAGEAAVYAMGGFVSYRREFARELTFVADAGLRWLGVEADVEVATRPYTNHFGQTVHFASHTKTEDPVMSTLRAGLTGKAGRGFLWQASAELQTAMAGAGNDWLLEKLASDFDATVLQVGIGRRW